MNEVTNTLQRHLILC